MQQPPSLDKKLTNIFVFYTLIVMLLAGSSTFIWSYYTEKRATFKDIHHKIQMFMQFSNNFFFKYDEPINQLLLNTSSQKDLKTLLQHLYFISPEDTYYVIDSQYRIIATTDQYTNMLPLSLHNFEPLKKKPVTDVFQSLFTNKSVVANTFAMPDGKILVIERDLSDFLPIANAFAKRFTTVESIFFILSGLGEVVYHPLTDLITTRHNLGFELNKTIPSSTEDSFSLITLNNDKYLLFAEEFAFPADWKAFYAIKYKAFVSNILTQVIWKVAPILIALLVLSLLIKRFLNRDLQMPLSEITSFLANINIHKNFDEPLDHQKFDVREYQTIALTFNSMMKNIKNSYSLIEKNEEKFRMLAEFSPVWVYWIDEAGNCVYMSPSAETITGYTIEDFTNDPFLMEKIIHPSDRGLFELHQKTIMTAGVDDPIEFRIITKEGQIKWIRHLCKKIYNAEGQFFGTRGSNTDITKRKNSELDLLQQKELLSITLESIGDGVISTNRDGLVVHINKEAERLTGWTKAEASAQPLENIFKIIHEETLESMQNPVELVLKTAKAVNLANHTILISKDGKKLPIADSAAPIIDHEGDIVGVVLVFRDVTEKKILEAETLKASKIESLSVLAGGIAHDFNNILTAIIGNLSLCKYFIEMDSKLYERLDVIERSAEKAKNLVTRLMTFAKGSMPVKRPLVVKKLLNDAASFILSGSNCTYEIACQEDISNIYADEGEITQVLHNLLINALHAMPQGGTIRISADVFINTTAKIPLLASGRYIKITIADTGIGIPPDRIDRVFDPYFTTKTNGSGLGLASAYSIVRRHDGHIEIHSKVSVGTTVIIYLPAFTGQYNFVDKDQELFININAKVLFMDDDHNVFDIAKQFLTKCGATVTHARDGHEAIRLYTEALENNQPFDVVILDLTVPGSMGGKEAISRLYEMDPTVKAIVTSGYSEDIILSNYQDYGFSGVLKKPFDFKSLVSEINRVIGNK